jgi:cellulose synthase/poly-beta-1,6-N-acetylglucosamine synthase-like glycosyltransferase
MLTTIALIAAQLLVAAALIQGSIAISFGRWFARQKSRKTQPGRQELAAVIMSVRGCDPSLRDSLAGVLKQDYDNYVVHLVVDHQSDLAWNFVHDVKAQLDHRDVLTIHELRDPPETCSLKCHAIVQILELLPQQVKYIALLDADVTPHPNWLAELTGPLSDPEIGGVTGNQWFEPSAPASIGSLTRSAWNAGALVFTIYFANPWAGSFAMRWKDLKNSGLADTWSRSIVDDGPIKQAIENIGLKIEFAPSLIMINREPCTFAYVNRWVTRMLTWSRLYERTFFLSVIHAAFSNLVMLFNFAILLVALAIGHWLAIGIISSGLTISGLLCVWAYVASRNCVAKSCQLRGETLPPMSLSRGMGVLSTVAIGHLIYGVSCARAMMLRQIKWREITYEVRRHDQVKRLNYQPYLTGESQSKVSI